MLIISNILKLFFMALILSSCTTTLIDLSKSTGNVKHTISMACVRINNNRYVKELKPQKLLFDTIAWHYGLPDNSKQIGTAVERFWSENHEDFICRVTETEPEGRTHLHILKMAVKYQMFDRFFDHFLTAEGSAFRYNLNAVEQVNKKGETLIDYINLILDTPDFLKHYDAKQLTTFKDRLINEYGAKTAEQVLRPKQARGHRLNPLSPLMGLSEVFKGISKAFAPASGSNNTEAQGAP